MEKIMNICTIANGHNYAIHTGVLIASILKNSSEKNNFHFHIISEDISKDDKNKLLKLREIKDFKIDFYKPIISKINKYKKWEEISRGKIKKWWSYHTLIKLDIPFILKDLDNVLFLDADMIVLKNINEVFNINLENFSICVARHPAYGFKYLNDEGIKTISKNLNIKKPSLENIIKHIFESSQKSLDKLNIKDKKSNDLFNMAFIYMNLNKLRNIFTDEKIDNFFNTMLKLDIDTIYEDWFYFKLIKNDEIIRVSENYSLINYHYFNDDSIENAIIINLQPLKTISKPYEEAWPKNNKNLYFYKVWEYLILTPWFKDNPFYFLDIYLSFETSIIDRKIKKIVDMLVWFIPIRSIRDRVRNNVLGSL